MKKNNLINILKEKRTIYMGLSLFFLLIVGILIYIFNTNYSFTLNFNDENILFFNKETLYFRDDVNISFSGDGYSTKINGDKFENNITLSEEGTYKFKFSKFFKSYEITINIDKDPEIYFVDHTGNDIHNYLSNNKAFKIINSSEDNNILVNNIEYEEDSVIFEEDNYIIVTNNNTYNINIIGINTEN